MPLDQHLSQCENDTRILIGNRAAGALSRWRHHQTQAEKVAFVQRLIRNLIGQGNAVLLSGDNRLSLEEIVLDREPGLFTEDDKRIAASTLGRTYP